ncbi:uncharacterized protein EDB93DRAFT_85739 [Suillus bovinus]|uniref:uncharacterized protein n=1 Tax=Suillus bovinus TaxID=48563 RepID=UPI001B86C965|nr:uncharacterized protein EDB93DRAFT_85739 [Suillus bovinus]KAG2130181.1 hypothetical protein EDB93DRAFT_85739 [Suillus bovinus]
MNEALLPHAAHSSNNLISAPSQENLFMDETTLGKLSRAQLQKVAKAHGVKANMKSVVIIRELVKLGKAVPLLQNEESGEPPKKKLRTTEEGHPAAGPSTRNTDLPMDTSSDPPIIEEDSPTSVLILAAENKTPTKETRHTGAPDNRAGKSPSLSPLVTSPDEHPAVDGESSDSGDSYLSYGSPSQQKSPVSSRAGTPPPEEPQLLSRAVDTMKQITADDQRILVQAAALRKRAAGLKEQAKNVRDVVRAEQGRRVRLEAYFTYWREIEPKWPKDWIYGEGEEDQIQTKRVLKTMTPPLPSTGPTGPPTLSSDGRDAPNSHRELRGPQLRPQQEAHEQENGAVDPPAEVEQPGERANCLPSPQFTTDGRAEKRKHCT